MRNDPPTSCSPGSAPLGRVEPSPEQAAERGRLAALRDFGVLDTAPERAFDELTALASRLCGTPMALVSLVDADRQWFKSHLGLDLCQTTRDVSFCAHALHSDAVLVVPDATKDARFAGNPLVTGAPHVRFYAGAPLVALSGHVLGTLCVLDVMARVLTQEQIETLTMLARQAVDQLELRRQADALATEVGARSAAETALRDSQRLLRGILDHTDAVIYAKDLDGRYLLANPAHSRLLGRQLEEVLGRSDDDLFPAMAAEDHRRHDRQVAVTGLRSVLAEQAHDPDGTVHSYLSTKFPLLDDHGRSYAVAGVSTDVTELVAARAENAASEQRWKALVEHSPAAVAVVGADGRFAYANPRAVALYGTPPGQLVGRHAAEFIPDSDDGRVAGLFAALLQDGPVVLAHRWTLRRMDATPVAVEVNAAKVSYDGQPAVQIELRDVSAQVAADGALRRSEERFRALWACSPVGAAEALADGTIVAVNPQLADMLGYAATDLVGRPSSVLLADPADLLARQDLQSLEQTSGYFSERVYRRKDGTDLDVLVGSAVVRDDCGRVHSVVGTVLDISERVRARDALNQAHAELEARQAFTAAVLDSVDIGIVACDAEGHLTLFNDATQRWHGIDLADRPQDAVDTSRFPEIFALHDAAGQPLSADQVPLTRALLDGEVRDAEIVISPHGRPATRVLCTGRALTAPDGRALGAVVAMTDITAARAQTRALQASEQRFRTTFTHDPAGLAVLTPDGLALQVNPAMCRLLDRTESELVALGDLTQLVSVEGCMSLTALTRQALSGGGAAFTAEGQMLRPDGTGPWVLLTATRLLDTDDERSLLLQVEDISARRDAEQNLTRQALHDGLTDLPNRTLLLERTSRALERLAREGGSGALAMLFVDLDGFKAVNDDHGHSAGDALLVEVAARLAHAIRPTDTVARLGGDEFVVLCEDLPDAAEATRIAARLAQAISEPVTWAGQLLSVTGSVGIAYGSAALSAEELVRCADTAMYQVKRLGKI